MQRVNTGGIGYVCLYKMLLIGYILIWLLLGSFFGLYSLFGYQTITINGHHVFGWYGLFSGICLGPMFGFLFATLNWLFLSAGLWIYTRFFSIELTYREVP